MSQDDRHLSEIATLWSVVRRAHDADSTAAVEAQRRLLGEYGGAARRYLLGALRNEELADEAFQEFSLRFVRGDFRNVSPEKGRFRSFLKTCLCHLIVDQQRLKKKQTRNSPLDSNQAPVEVRDLESAEDAAFTSSWRDDLLSRAWARLQQDEASSGKPYYTVLKTKAENPEAGSTELAALTTARVGREVSPANVRVLVHRSRELFAECLLKAVIDSLADSRREVVEEELIELQLIEYCRAALDKRPVS